MVQYIHGNYQLSYKLTVVGGYISSRFSSNSEAFASELLENLEEIYPRYG